MTQATYEASIQRLEEIVSALSSDTQPLSVALALYEEGLGHLRDASTELATIETKLHVLIEGANGVVVMQEL
jgi:exodeoxyribonuclease VII small subunit